MLPIGASGLPIGPIAPATRARPFAASRAIRAPSRLIFRTCASRPCGPSLKRWAPNVFVSITSAPGLEVLVVDLPDEAGVREVELVEAAVQEDAAGVEHRAHGPVEDDGPRGQAVEERLHGGGRGLVAHPPQSTAGPASLDPL